MALNIIQYLKLNKLYPRQLVQIFILIEDIKILTILLVMINNSEKLVSQNKA